MKTIVIVCTLVLLSFFARPASASVDTTPGDQAASPLPTPEAAEQHVTVPSLPGEPNKEGTVRAGGEIKTDGAGYPINNRQPVVPGASGSAPSPGANAAPGQATTSGPVPRNPNAKSPRGATPSSRNASATAASSTFMVKGKVKAYQPGASIRLALVKSGRFLSYSIAPDAVAPADLRLGEVVNVRIVNRGKARAVDLVERTTPLER